MYECMFMHMYVHVLLRFYSFTRLNLPSEFSRAIHMYLFMCVLIVYRPHPHPAHSPIQKHYTVTSHIVSNTRI